MTKRLIMLLVLAFVVGFACAAYAEVQNVKVGGELTTLAIERDNFDLGANENADASILAMIAKVKIDADLTDAVMLTMVLRNESVWGATRTSTGDGDIDLASANVTLKEFLNEAVTLKVGKMPVVLGMGLLVADPDTNRVATSTTQFMPGFGDLSSRKAFTGGMAVLDYSPLTVTLAALKVTENVTTGDDSNAYVASLAYKIDDKNTAAVDYVLKNTESSDVNNYGVRLVSNAVDNLSLTGEYVYQTQKGIRPADKKASDDSGMLLTANYRMPDMKYAPSLGLLYLRVSDNWNSMYEGLTAGDIINAILPLTDCQVIGATLMAKVMDDLTLNLAYTNAKLLTTVSDAALPTWYGTGSAPGYYNMTDKKDLGNEVDLKLTYDYTEDVQLALTAGYFNPGKAFDEANRKSASQVIGSMKVTF